MNHFFFTFCILQQKQEFAPIFNVKFTKNYKNERQINPKIIEIKEKIKEKQKTEEFVPFSIQYKGKKLFIEKFLAHSDAEPLESKVFLNFSLISELFLKKFYMKFIFF